MKIIREVKGKNKWIMSEISLGTLLSFQNALQKRKDNNQITPLEEENLEQLNYFFEKNPTTFGEDFYEKFKQAKY